MKFGNHQFSVQSIQSACSGILLNLLCSFIFFFCSRGPVELGPCQHVTSRVRLYCYFFLGLFLGVTKLTEEKYMVLNWSFRQIGMLPVLGFGWPGVSSWPWFLKKEGFRVAFCL